MLFSPRFVVLMIGCALAAVVLAGCGQRTLLSNVAASTTTISPNGDGVDDQLAISYSIGAPANVSAMITAAGGETYMLRQGAPRVPSTEPYTLVFDGTVPMGSINGGSTVQQRVLPDGDYTWTITAQTEAGQEQTQSGTFAVRDAASDPPTIEDLSVSPRFSPNEDADEDLAYFSYRLPISATVTINFTDSAQRSIPFITEVKEGPYAQSHVWDGKEANGALVTAGTYTYTITARDTVGNIAQRQGQIEVEQPGRSDARIVSAYIAPTEVALGNTITITMRVRNTGEVPIKTQGPPSGFAYSTNDTFSAIENNAYAEKGGGFWRAGVDWGGGRAYPFRWAMTPRSPDQWAEPGVFDYLQPGEEADITGTVTIDQREDRMEFYAGLIHEGVGYPQDNVSRTPVCVSIPGAEDRCLNSQQ